MCRWNFISKLITYISKISVELICSLMAISGYFVLCALFGTSQLVAAGYLPQMCKTVT